MNNKGFTESIIRWYLKHGRTDLPWKNPATPYRVWISEVMLQQTQVSTVIPYFKRFMHQFPSLSALAQSDLNQVLALWSGLGYYARARNLHQSAQIIKTRFHGRFPKTVENLCELPGIGRSTAGAIVSFAMKTSASILDGNVKRVLSRYHAILGDSGQSQLLKQLWQLADKYTPLERCKEYNQAIMDLGALICTRSEPKCKQCPLMSSCLAFKENDPLRYPQKKPTKRKPQKHVYMLILQNATQDVLLEKRPNTGIWGGLWGFPECTDKAEIILLCMQHYHCEILSQKPLPPLNHLFTHFKLTINPIILKVKAISHHVRETNTHYWYNNDKILPGGIATPVAKLLKKIHQLTEEL